MSAPRPGPPRTTSRRPLGQPAPSVPAAPAPAASKPLSIVLPALDDRELLAAHLPCLFDELARAVPEAEVLVVDDTGEDALTSFCAQRFPRARVLANARNLGFARAVRAGLEAAAGELALVLNPDVRVREGFLPPLLAALQSSDDLALVAPLVLLEGKRIEGESLPRVVWREGLPRVEPLALDLDPTRPETLPAEPIGVDFVLGGAMLGRRAELLERGPFDPLFEPFYFEDADLGLRLSREGRRCAVVPRSLVEHHHRGTIGPRVPERLVRRAIERNRLLLAWRHGDVRTLRAHLSALEAAVLEHAAAEERAPLVHLALALYAHSRPG